MKVIVEVENLQRIYRQGDLTTIALDGVNLQVHEGDFIALAGPSGSGKTTLLNLIGGLDTPSFGHVRVEGKELGRMSKTELATMRRERIGFIFQSYNLIPVLTAFENAELVMLLQNHQPELRRKRVMEVLEKVGLAGLEGRFPNQLSGGQQQRVAIARAIAARPAIVLADEPTANLDSKTAHGLLETMKLMNQAEKTTFIFSTHDPAVMEQASKLILIKDGKIDSVEVR